MLNNARAERLLRTSRERSDSAADAPAVSQGFGVGTIKLTNLSARSIEVYDQNSPGEASWQPGYAGALSPETPALQVPIGTYKLKFSNHFLERVVVKSGGDTQISLGGIAIDNLTRAVEVYDQKSPGEASWQAGYAGELSPKNPALHIPAGVYKLKFANKFVENVRVESGKTVRLK